MRMFCRSIKVQNTLLNSRFTESLYTRQETKSHSYILTVFCILIFKIQAKSETPTFRTAKAPTTAQLDKMRHSYHKQQYVCLQRMVTAETVTKAQSSIRAANQAQAG